MNNKINLRQAEYNQEVTDLSSFHEGYEYSIYNIIVRLRQLINNNSIFQAGNTKDALNIVLDVLNEDIMSLLKQEFGELELLFNTAIDDFNYIDN